MDGLQRLTQIIYMDASHKYGVAKTMDAETIDQLYTMKSQMSTSASILPINDNARFENDPKFAVSKAFRTNEREVIAGETHETPVLSFETPSPQKIKANIFGASARNMLHWSPVARFSSAGKTKSQPMGGMHVAYKSEEFGAISETPDVIVFDDVVVPFKRKTLTLAS